jgi:putative intracellular protease/amidase
MARIAVIFAQSFEESEYLKPARTFRRAGRELIHVGRKEEKIVKN